jgi:uncharacterized protein YbcC (UPF0753/DUF2309 family)
MVKKHKWHCGDCHSDLLIMKRTKGTKYLFCPICDHQKAYFNFAPLVGLGLSLAGSVASKVIKKKISPQKQPNTPLDRMITDNLDKPNIGERIINMELQRK